MVVKVIELVGSSIKSWVDVVRSTVQETSESLRHSSGLDDSGAIREYRVTLYIAFLVEYHTHLIGSHTESSEARHWI
ncbi:MAG: dodecin family protein [Pirellula sp.]|jgi:flavin-binding protein dodecin